MISSVRDVMLGVELLKQRLERWAKRCGVYEGVGIDRGAGHRLGQCQEAKGQTANRVKEKIRQEIRFEPFGQCFKCGLPQEVCDRWMDNRVGGYCVKRSGGWCQYMGVLLEVVIGISVRLQAQNTQLC